MIKVGFIFDFDLTWNGGINYFNNLFRSIYSIQQRKIEVIILLGNNSEVKPLNDLKGLKFVRSGLFDKKSLLYLLRRLFKKIFSVDLFLVYICKKNGINLISHSGYIGKYSPIACIGNIFDLQHKCMPEFFGKREIYLRNKGFEKLNKYCDSLILSSLTSQLDFASYYPKYSYKVKILRFVGSFEKGNESKMEWDFLKDKYQLPKYYFHLPNQFWKHKNHFVVLKAIDYLNIIGIDVFIVCTGKTDDYRDFSYFPTISSYINKNSLEKHFIILGNIPMKDVQIIMKNSIAVINPSLFEGWSTSVEEAKILNKQIILSSIPVHIEQAPDRGYYFDPHDFKKLANLFYELKNNYNEDIENKMLSNAKKFASIKIQKYGEAFQDIVFSTLNQRVL